MRVLYVTLFIVLFDQITKLLVKGFTLPIFNYYHQGMQLGQSFPVIGDFLRITFVENPGMVFGLEIGGQLLRALFTLAASLGILYYIYHVRKEPLIVRLTLAMILGGAVGNLIDRVFYGVIFGEAPLFYGRVVDFIDADFFNIDLFGIHMERFAVFNIADSAVSTGIVLMLLFHHKFSKTPDTLDKMDNPEKAEVDHNSVLANDAGQKSGEENSSVSNT